MAVNTDSLRKLWKTVFGDSDDFLDSFFRIAFSPDPTWQQEFEAAFPFEETADQLRAIEEIKADMERAKPMERLLCGDVGFGKTEVAVRAAFKAVMSGYQVDI